MKKTLEEQFKEFDSAHPQIYQEFKKRTFQMMQRGFTHYSADGILHVVRFHTNLSGKPDDAFKINNNHAAFFARKWRAEFPEHASFFETRVQKSVLPPATAAYQLHHAIGH